MFQKNPSGQGGNQSKNPSPFLNNSSGKNPDPKNNFQPKEDLVIHSMSGDLKAAEKGFSGADLKNIAKPVPKENPPFSQVKVSKENIPPKIIPTKQPDKKQEAPKEKTYDFSFSANKEQKTEKKPENREVSNALLNQNSWQKNNSLNKKEDIYVKGDKEDKAEKKEENKEHHGLGKVITFAIALSVILIAGAGGYYFWMTRMNGNENPPVDVPNNTGNDNPTENPEPVLLSFSTESPNYLKMDFASADKSTIESVLKENMDKVYESKIAVPVEFILTDNENNPISFSNFAERANVVLSKGVSDNLDDSFSIFVYVDNDMPRIGMAVGSKDDNLLKKALLLEESGLVSDLSVIFAGIAYSLDENAAFKSSKYMENDVRYLNIPSSENLSVDYSVSDSQWIIGTSQMTLHAILDNIAQENEPEEAGEAVNQEEITSQEIEASEALEKEE